MTGQLQSDSSQVGSVSEGQESRTGRLSKHILLKLRSLVTPHLREQDEEDEEGEGGITHLL